MVWSAKKKKAAIAISVGLASIVFFLQHNMNKGDKIAGDGMSQQLEQKILVFDLVNYAESGSKKWQLKGDSADIMAEIVNLSNINIVTYDDPSITLTSYEGTYNRRNKEVTLFDDVEVITADGAVLITDYLKWHSATDRITTDKHIRILRSDLIADGRGADVLRRINSITINKDVKVRIVKEMLEDIDIAGGGSKKDDKENPVKAVITCSGPLEIDYENNIAVFKNNVKVDDKKGEGQIYSDIMEAILDPETKNITKVVATGDVKVVRGEDATFSERAIYTTDDQKIILVGKPEIHIRSLEGIDKIEEGFGGL